jgi:hypothetical protein
MATTELTAKPLFESDRVEGTGVYDPQGNNIGSIKRLMIEKISGRVAYGFGGYRTDITKQQLRGRQLFRGIETTTGLIETANGTCIAILVPDHVGSRETLSRSARRGCISYRPYAAP